MRAIGRFLILLIISMFLTACGGDSNGKPQQVQLPDPPAPPAVTVSADIKELVFRWDEVDGATHYRLLENPDGHSGFTQVGDNVAAGTLMATKQLAVHLHEWVSALYIVQACNGGGCTGSTEVSATKVMLDSIGYFKASNTESLDRFGSAVAMSADGRTVAVSANGEDSNSTGINGDQSDNEASNSGSVYIFRLDGAAWTQEAYVKASNTDPSDYFGGSLALSRDGDTLAIGASWEQSSATDINGDQLDNSADRSGAVYVFRFDGVSWRQEAYVKASNSSAKDRFGNSVALSADGNTLAVAAVGVESDSSSPTGGAVYIFRFENSSWAQEACIRSSSSIMENSFGAVARLSADSTTLVVGTWSEAVYVYRHDDTQWREESRITASNTGSEDRFGLSVAISADGNTLAVGAELEDSDSTGINGDQDLNESQWEEHDAGAAYLLRFDGSQWVQEAYIKASNSDFDDKFGGRLALSNDGSTLAVGARAEGSAALGVNGDQYAISADGSSAGSGAVYIFRFGDSVWSQVAYVKASNVVGNFGGSLDLGADGNTLVVGAVRDDSNATGIGGDQNDDSERISGAVYVY